MKSTLKFTHEVEEKGRVSFLDVLVICQLDGSIKTELYKKPTHTNKYLNFRSCHPISQTLAVIKTLTERLSPILSDEKS